MNSSKKNIMKPLLVLLNLYFLWHVIRGGSSSPRCSSHRSASGDDTNIWETHLTEAEQTIKLLFLFTSSEYQKLCLDYFMTVVLIIQKPVHGLVSLWWGLRHEIINLANRSLIKARILESLASLIHLIPKVMLILLHHENICNNDFKIYAPEGTVLEQ